MIEFINNLDINDVVYSIMILVVVACLVQTTTPRRKVGFILLFGILAHAGFNWLVELASPFVFHTDALLSIPDMIYYGSAMITSMFVIRAITRLKFAPKIAEYVILASFFSIGLNYIEAWMMFKEVYSDAYSITFIVLYSWLFYKLTRGEQGNARDYQHDNLISNLRYSHN